MMVRPLLRDSWEWFHKGVGVLWRSDAWSQPWDLECYKLLSLSFCTAIANLPGLKSVPPHLLLTPRSSFLALVVTTSSLLVCFFGSTTGMSSFWSNTTVFGSLNNLMHRWDGCRVVIMTLNFGRLMMLKGISSWKTFRQQWGLPPPLM